jgi:chromosome segregation ATPase
MNGVATVTARNVGGIDEAEVSLTPGLTLLTGPNATNRTSLLKAIEDVLGGSEATLRTDAQSGAVELTAEDSEETYRCQYDRSSGTVSADRTPYSDESEYVDLFVSLLEDNRARQAVERADGGELRKVIMEPVDTGEIQRQIRSRSQERQEIVNQLAEIKSARSELPGKEQRRTAAQEDLNEIATEIEKVETEIDQHQADLEEAEEAEALVDELDELRNREREIQSSITTKEQTLERATQDRADVTGELEALPTEDSLESARSDLTDLEEQQHALSGRISDLRDVIEFIEDLQQDDSALPGTGNDERADTQDPTAALDPMSETVECWICGNQVERQVIRDRIDELRDRADELRDERSTVKSQRREAQDHYSQIKATRDERKSLERRQRELDTIIENTEGRIETLNEDLEGVRDEIEQLKADIEDTEELRESDLLEIYRRLSDLEYDRGKTQRELDTVADEIERLDSLTDDREHLEAQRAELTDEVSELRTRIEDIERAAIESFNEQIGTIIDLLDYRNIERVWIESKSQSGSSQPASKFELHVIRTTEDETAYEDTIDTLSESEREVIGLAFALAGYLAHDVHEEVPFILLDSLEAIDANRLRRVFEHFSSHAEYLIAAVLPEDWSALSSKATTRISAKSFS